MNIKIILLILCFSLSSCFFQGHTKLSPLESKIKIESQKAERRDDFILGLKLGQNKKTFYDLCWQLNKEKKISNGTQSASVMYLIKDSVGREIEMNFFPRFFENKIYKFDVTLNYKAWAPWNKDLWAEAMLKEVPLILNTLFGEAELLQIQKNNTQRFYRVESNRLMHFQVADEKFVSLIVRDLTVTLK